MTSPVDKLKGFPHVYYINMDSNVARNEHVQQHLVSYGIGSYERIPGVTATPEEINKYIKSDYYIAWTQAIGVPLAALGCTLAHLLAVKKFAESEHEIAIICEDDMDFSLVKYWNFTWEQMYDLLPNDWGMLQLSITYMDQYIANMSFLPIQRWNERRCSSVAYMITKKRAIEMTNFYFNNGNLAAGRFANAYRPVSDLVQYLFSREDVYSLNLLYSNNGKVSPSNIHSNHEPMVQIGMNILETAWATNQLTIQQIMELK